MNEEMKAMTTHDMTKKKQRNRETKKSSSSKRTARSKPPTDILELGKYLVRELEFEDSFDTLGRWMSHHVAKIIHQAENGSTQQEREDAEKKAVDIILRIWEHKTHCRKMHIHLHLIRIFLKYFNT